MSEKPPRPAAEHQALRMIGIEPKPGGIPDPLYAVGDPVKSTGTILRFGQVTVRKTRVDPLTGKLAWYYRVRWARAKRDEGLYHETLINANPDPGTGWIAHISVGGPTRQISVNGEIIHFEMHPYCGPALLNAKGDPADDQQPDHPFWTAVSHWAQQGERIDPEGLCIWDWPPEPITTKINSRNYIVTGHTEARPGS